MERPVGKAFQVLSADLGDAITRDNAAFASHAAGGPGCLHWP